MDVLTDVLETLRVRAACSGRIEASAPWGLEVPPSEFAWFHVMLEGRALLRVEGQEPIELFAGDLVALPHGGGHSLIDAEGAPARSMDALMAGSCPRGPVRVGGEGASATVWGGRIEFEDRRSNPLLAVLPRVITLRGELARQVRWLEPTLAMLACESASERPGAQTVVSRLADVIFIQIVRGYLATLGREGTGWLASLADSQVGGALALVHQNPERNWTVQELAQRVAMSRSAFAARFTRLMGEPPLHYVTRWRMQKAASLLRDGQASIAQVAESVGYDSEAAFSKAFKRALGTAPGAYRRSGRPRSVLNAA